MLYTFAPMESFDKGKYAFVDTGVKIRTVSYNPTGEKCVLLIPELNYPLEFYEQFMVEYKKCRVVSADLIGQGQSERVDEYSLNLFVSQFAAVIGHYELASEETHLLCHGFGCVVGALLSQQYSFKSVSFVAPLIYQKPYDKSMYRQGLGARLVQSLSCGRSRPD